MNKVAQFPNRTIREAAEEEDETGGFYACVIVGAWVLWSVVMLGAGALLALHWVGR